MKVYDVWCSELTEVMETVWATVYAYTIDEMWDYMEKCFPGSDWIIIENELPF